jgi:hypothetical protein
MGRLLRKGLAVIGTSGGAAVDKSVQRAAEDQTER